MELLLMPGNVVLPALSSAEQAAWEATNPIDRGAILNYETGALVYWDGDSAVAIEIFLGRTMKTVYVSVATAETSYTNAGLVGATVTKVFRPSGLYQPVTGTPANTFEIQFDTATGTLTMFSGDSVEETETWAIEYFGVPDIS
jgi:hypothetical protein